MGLRLELEDAMLMLMLMLMLMYIPRSPLERSPLRKPALSRLAFHLSRPRSLSHSGNNPKLVTNGPVNHRTLTLSGYLSPTTFS